MTWDRHDPIPEGVLKDGGVSHKSVSQKKDPPLGREKGNEPGRGKGKGRAIWNGKARFSADSIPCPIDLGFPRVENRTDDLTGCSRDMTREDIERRDAVERHAEGVGEALGHGKPDS